MNFDNFSSAASAVFSRFKMATNTDAGLFAGTKMSSIEEDFTHGVTVAQTNVKIRLG